MNIRTGSYLPPTTTKLAATTQGVGSPSEPETGCVPVPAADEPIAVTSEDAAATGNVEYFCCECGRYLDGNEPCIEHPKAPAVTERELRRLERENSVLIRPEPTGVKAGCYDI